ncbi:hypothetical protein C1645_821047 [Glomus cerebriforme]|uniref:Uncharacterized protein n=1 Tax=Glomus cerebriforme TaxID=658196 RepID=A0A397T112_9GLOM|nr:hypothetical protein C1645_821047 [Glomus cerebriforme]
MVNLSVFGPILESGNDSLSSSVRKCFSMLSVQYWNQKQSLDFWSNTRKWEWSLSFRLILESGNDFPSVRTLGIRKRFLDFISALGIWNWKHSALGIQDWKHSTLKMETEMFTLGLEILKHSVCFLKFGFLEIRNVSGLDIRIE